MSVGRAYDEATLYSVLRYWVFATTMGFLVGGVVAMGFELASYDLNDPYGVVSADWTLAGGLSFGSVVAVLLQGLVLRRHALWAARWLAFSGVGLVVGVVLSALLRLDPFFFPGFLLAVTCLGIAQGLALRGRVPRAWLWVLVSGIAWLASVPVGQIGIIFIGYPLGMLVAAIGGNVGAIVGGLVAQGLVWVALTGGVVGVATGLLLRALLRRRSERPSRVR